MSGPRCLFCRESPLHFGVRLPPRVQPHQRHLQAGLPPPGEQVDAHPGDLEGGGCFLAGDRWLPGPPWTPCSARLHFPVPVPGIMSFPFRCPSQSLLPGPLQALAFPGEERLSPDCPGGLQAPFEVRAALGGGTGRPSSRSTLGQACAAPKPGCEGLLVALWGWGAVPEGASRSSLHQLPFGPLS